jgi:tetratricopeptide (TPR) repeat protein
VARLFLSYSRKDASRAERFTQWLEREGHDVWRDEDDIGGGASFSSEIEKALNDCDAVLVLWSAESVQSAWVRDEAGFGRDKGKLIPLSLDGTEPPLGFRQFQSIDLSKWKGHGPPPAAERIRGAIDRVSGSSPAGASATPVPIGRTRAIRERTALAAVLAVLVAAGALGVFLWQRSARNQALTIAVMPSPASPDRATAADYANIAAADMAAFLGTHFDRATVIAPADAAGRTSGYRVLISATPHGKGADASVTMSDSDGHTIIWSKSWSVPDASVVDLRGEVSRFASNAALCLTDAKGGSNRLSQPALGAYMGGCAGIADSDWSDAQVLAAFERVVKLAPDFPQGWASLAVGRAIFASEQEAGPPGPYAEAVQSARQAIAEARRLNPKSALPYVAEYHLLEDDRFRALDALERGAKVEPDNSVVQMNLADALMDVGRMSESVQAAQRAVELNPLSPFARSHYILALAYAGEISKAKADIVEARKKWPNDPQIDWAEFGVQYRYGDPRIAEQLLPRTLDYSDARLIPYRKLIAARLDPTPGKIDDVIAEFRARWQNNPQTENLVLLALGTFGKTDEAYQLLNDPKFQHDLTTDALFRPEFAPVRADPRFMAVAARTGLVRYWKATGIWPDFCSAEQLKYDCKSEAAKYPG